MGKLWNSQNFEISNFEVCPKKRNENDKNAKQKVTKND